MAKQKVSKHDEYVEKVKEFAVYVDSEIRTVGIYATNEDATIANKSFALKKLKSLYRYHIQMVVK